MPQILVGGDNQDAYLICEALEKMSAPRGQPVVFCATPHEVLSTVGRGGAVAVVLNFEKAGLTNFELAYRIRESGEGHSIPLLLPEIDALGDVAGALGKQVGIFTFPVKPGAVAALACKLIDAAAPAPSRAAATPAAPRPPASRPPPPPAATRPPVPASPDLSRPQAARLDSAALAPAHGGGSRPAAPSRSRRVRHRTWMEVRSPRREAPVEEDPDDDSAPPLRSPATRPMSSILRGLAILLGVLALAGLAYGGFRALRANPKDVGVPTPSGTVALMCMACDAREERPVQNIHDLRCRLCGGKLGFAFHCNDCKKDFGFIPTEKQRTLADLKAKPECRLCKSWNTKAMPPAVSATAKKASPAPPETAKKASPTPAPRPAKPAKAPGQAGEE
jgi:hypothetical protein